MSSMKPAPTRIIFPEHQTKTSVFTVVHQTAYPICSEREQCRRSKISARPKLLDRLPGGVLSLSKGPTGVSCRRSVPLRLGPPGSCCWPLLVGKMFWPTSSAYDTPNCDGSVAECLRPPCAYLSFLCTARLRVGRA